MVVSTWRMAGKKYMWITLLSMVVENLLQMAAMVENNFWWSWIRYRASRWTYGYKWI
jgi:hypothetical protein